MSNCRRQLLSLAVLLAATTAFAAPTLAQDSKKVRMIGQPWRDWQARTSFVPFAALLQGKVRWSAMFPGWIALGGGLVLWALVTSYHAPMVSPLGDLLSR